jgi:hypothetical protein
VGHLQGHGVTYIYLFARKFPEDWSQADAWARNIANWTGLSNFHRRFSRFYNPAPGALVLSVLSQPDLPHPAMVSECFAIGKNGRKSGAQMRVRCGSAIPCGSLLGLTLVASNAQACSCAQPSGAKTMREVAERYSEGPTPSKIIFEGTVQEQEAVGRPVGAPREAASTSTSDQHRVVSLQVLAQLLWRGRGDREGFDG